MSVILQITRAGRIQKGDARANNQPLPPFIGFVVDMAETQADLDNPSIIPLYTSQPSDTVVIQREDDAVFSIRSLIPPTAPAGWVRGIGLLTAPDVVYAYGRFSPATNGVYKPAGFGIELYLLHAEDGRSELTFTYSAIDLEVEITQRLNTFFATVMDRLAKLEECCNQNAAQAGFAINSEGDLIYTEDSSYSPLVGVEFAIDVQGDLIGTGEEALVNRLSINSAGDLILTGDA